MKRHILIHFALICSFSIFLTCCGNTNDDENGNGGNTPGDQDATEEELDATEAMDAGNSESVEEEHYEEYGEEAENDPVAACTEISFDMHESASGQVFVVLSEMTAYLEDTSTYDFVFAKVHGQGPTGYLGDGVAALNVGDGTAFEEYDEAPAGEYSEDGDGPVIGTGWQEGGSGTEGFIPTGNIYVLKLANGTFAKISVTSAKDGLVTIDAFHQANGSNDLQCAFEE